MIFESEEESSLLEKQLDCHQIHTRENLRFNDNRNQDSFLVENICTGLRFINL